MPTEKNKKNLRKVLGVARELAKQYLEPNLVPDCYAQSKVHTYFCQCADCLKGLRKSRTAAGQCWHRSTQFNQQFRRVANKQGLRLRQGSETGLHFFSILSLKNKTANVVIDFTFRQFSRKSPFPLVLPYGDYYKKHMDGVAR